MKIKALKAFRQGSTGQMIEVGQEFEEAMAGRVKHYEDRGMAHQVVAVKAGVKARAATARKPTPAKPNKAETKGPLASAGGRTGAARRSSSSRAAPAPKTPA